MADDRALLHAARAHWVLVPAAAARKRTVLEAIDSCDVLSEKGCDAAYLRIALPEGSVQIGGVDDLHVGSSPSSNIHVDCSQVLLQAPGPHPGRARACTLPRLAAPAARSAPVGPAAACALHREIHTQLRMGAGCPA